jgi:phosphate-selective porin
VVLAAMMEEAMAEEVMAEEVMAEVEWVVVKVAEVWAVVAY